MKNYLVIKDGFEKIIQSEDIQQNTQTGQVLLWNKEKDRVVAVLPKEAIVIETEELTDYQKILQEIILSLSEIRHNDFERKHPSLMELEDFKKMLQLQWLKHFEELYEKTL